MRVLLTGANGFIGRNVTERLVGQNMEFVTLGRSGKVDLLHDLQLPMVWTPDQPIDAVLHLAAESGVRDFDYRSRDNNLEATQNVLDWATTNKVKMVLLASSASVYGNQTLMEETTSCVPMSPSAESKYDCEILVNRWAKQEGRVGVNMRVFNAVGKHQRAGTFPDIVCNHFRKLKAGDTDELKIFGSRLRSWTYVGDVVNGFWSALQTFYNGKAGTKLALNLGTSAMLNQRAFVDLIADRVKIKPNIVQMEPNPLDIQRTKADMARFSAIFGWLPDHRNIAVAIDELVHEYGLSG